MNSDQIYHVDFKQSKRIKSFQYAGGVFQLTSDGVIFIGKDKDNNELPARWICSSLSVVAKTRDASSGEWGRLLEWVDDDEIKHQWAMPLALLQGDSSDIRRELARLGLTISPSKTARDLLASYIQVFPVEERARCVDKLGWYKEVFVTANEAIGQSSDQIVFQNANSLESALSVAGSVEDWRNSIAHLANSNSRLIFAISAAFAPSLANLVGEDSGGFHFRGASSSGKTTALKVAASVWGKPDSYIRLWRSTANGLEGLAALHNDGLLILDELSQMDPKDAGECAYLLANGQGKTRASRCGTARQSMRWSLLFLSAGEESLTSLMAKAGQRCNAGQEIRLADIEADAGAQMGLFEQLHNHINPASMSLALKEVASQYHGAVGLAWLHKIINHRAELIPLLANKIQQFVVKVTKPEHSGQIQRVARRFALVAMAGEMASHFELTGWERGAACQAAEKCFNTWLEDFGEHGNREDRAILSQVRAFFEKEGASRFENENHPNSERLYNRAGFFYTDNAGFRIFMVLSEVYRKEICQGFEPKMVNKVLINAGWIVPGNDGNASQKRRIKGIGIPRCYIFTEKVWSDEF
jgi:putative DNA primase/helicase